MFPILVRLGPLTLYGFPTLLNLGLVAGAFFSVILGHRRGLQIRSLVDLVLAAGVGGLLLGRAGYVVLHWDYYVQHHHLDEAFRFWRGGLQWQVALLGALGTLALLSAVRRLRFRRALDLLAPGGAVVALFGWLACLSVGGAWGVETYPGQGLLWSLSMDLPDLYGIRQPRVPVQLLGVAWSAVTLGVVTLLQTHRRTDGTLFYAWLLLHGVGVLGLGFLRADPVPVVSGWRVDQLANGALTAAGALLLLAGLLQTSSPGEERA